MKPMVGSLTSEVIIFAIHSALKLGNAFEKTYANSIKGKSIVLPLPAFNSTESFSTAERFFRRGEGNPIIDKLDDSDELKELHNLAVQGEDKLSASQKENYLKYFKDYYVVVEGNSPTVNVDDLVGIFRIRQWEQGTVKNITPLQMIAGTMVEIGIDYFNQVPGAIRSDSTHAGILRAFLSAVDNIDFTNGDPLNPLKEAIIKEVVPKLFISVSESLDKLTSNIGGDAKLQDFIHATSQGLTKDIYDRITNKLDTAGNQEEVIQWGQLVFKSLIKNSGAYVFNAPNQVFGANQSQSALIQAVGKSLMSAILDDNESGLDLKNAFTVDTLNNVVKSSLEVVAQYPSLVSDKKGIKTIVVDIASSVASSGIKQPGLVPELVRMVLTSTAGNLDQLWNIKDDSAKHLLVSTSKQVLLALSTTTPGNTWRPKLTNQQILAIAEYTFHEVVQNQAWIEHKVNEDSLLGEVFNTTFNSLGAIPEGQRLNFDTLNKIIKINLTTVATSKLVLSKIKWGTNQQETTILNKVLDLILAFVFKEDTTNGGDKVACLFDILEYVMEIVISKHPNEKGLVITQLLLNANSGVIEENGLNKDIANQLIKASLGAISANPTLLVNDKALQNIIAGVAAAFQSSGIKQPGLLGEFIRISLVHTSANLEHMIPDSNGKPQQLVVLGLKTILEGLTPPPNSGKWKPKLSGIQLFSLSEILLDEVVRNPNWLSDKVNQDSLLQEALGITFAVLNKHPKGQRINFETLREITELSLRAVAINKLILTPDLQKQTILEKAMDLVFEFVFNEPSTIDKSQLLLEVLDYILEVIIADHPNDEGLIIVMTLLQKDLGIVTSTGIKEDLANQLVVSSLNALAEHPELISDKIGIQNIVVGVTSTLASSGINQPGVISEFIRLILENTAGNLNQIIDTSKRTQKNILVLALQQVLKAISKRPSSGKWKPELTPVQILEITEMILSKIIDNSLWVKNDFLQSLIEIVYQSMEQVPRDKPLHFSTIETLIKESINSVDTRLNLAVTMITAADGSQKLALNYSLDGLFAIVFDESNGTIGSWTLTQSNTLNTIIHYYLSFLTGQEVNKNGMDEAIAKIKKAMDDLNSGLLFKLQDLLDSLEIKA
jgi:hypothetical protein